MKVDLFRRRVMRVTDHTPKECGVIGREKEGGTEEGNARC